MIVALCFWIYQGAKDYRILVGGGSAVKIIPKTTPMQLGITVDELPKSCLTVQALTKGDNEQLARFA